MLALIVKNSEQKDDDSIKRNKKSQRETHRESKIKTSQRLRIKTSWQKIIA